MHLTPSSRSSIAVMVLMTFTLLTGCDQEQTGHKEVIRPVKLFKVKDPQQQQLRYFPGKVTATEEAEISFRIPGQIDKVEVKQGDDVTEGQVLAYLDDRDIRNELQDRQANYELAKAEFERASSLLEKRVISQSSYDTASARLKSAEAALKLSRDKLAYTTLTAPFSGRVAQTLAEAHQQVQAQQPVLILQSSDRLDISIQVPESIVSHVNANAVNNGYQPIATFPGAPGKEFPVNYKEHATRVTPGTQSYEVIFTRMAPTNMNILPGMTATVIIDLARVIDTRGQPGYVLVPISAVSKTDTDNKTVVWLFDQATSQVAPVEVTTGRITEAGIQVLSGLNTGDQIVTAGLSQLYDGMTVKPLHKERGL
ncbi:efflux RND transporter periplasmic adaptor subunit [Endozoicomonas sp. GU-1]|uniref:efflux RND transporter periplasmic adaptor subunit n=1 Tax=Endozoicomonas sp. GU-1 TaxID=3009078 RepID=UPI0022B51D2B|nr:efflux RND transporter periplasmic adaptor subunit [Endozoicomonas sp. GU-1]WBA80400.1 efflux RND transporter periplasmic adaptor subunit [Endozoicomonas sp. GU-1]WBA87965.1 efflux RND transporter periplasmic adaptor subunit [Endozoicomonas sp. GU-1]